MLLFFFKESIIVKRDNKNKTCHIFILAVIIPRVLHFQYRFIFPSGIIFLLSEGCSLTFFVDDELFLLLYAWKSIYFTFTSEWYFLVTELFFIFQDFFQYGFFFLSTLKMLLHCLLVLLFPSKNGIFLCALCAVCSLLYNIFVPYSIISFIIWLLLRFFSLSPGFSNLIDVLWCRFFLPVSCAWILLSILDLWIQSF